MAGEREFNPDFSAQEIAVIRGAVRGLNERTIAEELKQSPVRIRKRLRERFRKSPERDGFLIAVICAASENLIDVGDLPDILPRSLSSREEEVALLLLLGYKTGQVAKKMAVSEVDVNERMQGLFNAFGVNNRYALAAMLVKVGK